ncbi:MAG: ROK family protein [Clostridiales bacterium]|jgi:glucokinase|nr:ROK family protein [Clostridiales bacterium]
MYYIGVDLGGTNIAAGLFNESGQFIDKNSIPTQSRREAAEILKDLAFLCKGIIEKNKLDLKEVDSIGIGSPGFCDSDNTVVVYSNNLNFHNVNIKEHINRYIDLPVFLDNDANCAAYGENLYGACAGAQHSITVTLGTGIGGGIISNGKIVRGKSGSGGEIGHTTLVFGGEMCTCGRSGCWEAYASATALIRDIKIAAIKNPTSMTYKEIDNDFNKVDAKFAFDMAEMGDPIAQKIVDDYIVYVSEGLANIINIFDPEIVAIGGGVANRGEKIMAPIRELTAKNCFGGILSTKVVTAKLGNDAGIIGAAFLSKL